MRTQSVAVISYRFKDSQDLKRLKNAAHWTNNVLHGTHRSRCTRERGVARLQRIRKRYDPHRIMRLIGGFKF